MLIKEQKIKLVLMLKKGIITKHQLQSVLKIGFPLPVLIEEKPDPENLGWIYRNLGQKIIGITFEAI
jgi:hypothetical protein